jgi:hypothetical protein
MRDSETQLRDQRILQAARAGVADAIETHRRMGRAIVVWENGEIVKLKPKDIPPRSLPSDEPSDS